MTAIILYTVRQVSDATGIGEISIRKAINQGNLVALRLGKSVRIRPADLEAWIESFGKVIQ